jgi:hypothetical protein
VVIVTEHEYVDACTELGTLVHQAIHGEQSVAARMDELAAAMGEYEAQPGSLARIKRALRRAVRGD